MFSCPHCASDTTIRQVLPRRAGDTYRRRRCKHPHCGADFVTIETLESRLVRPLPEKKPRTKKPVVSETAIEEMLEAWDRRFVSPALIAKDIMELFKRAK